GVAEIERTRGGLETIHPHALDHYLAGRGTLDVVAHVPEGLQRGERIFTFEEAFHRGEAVGERTKHDRTMRDGFVARHADVALEHSARADVENEIVGFVAGSRGVHSKPSFERDVLLPYWGLAELACRNSRKHPRASRARWHKAYRASPSCASRVWRSVSRSFT